MQRLASCPFCQGPLGAYWRAASFDRCTNCGLVLRNPFPSEADLSALYEQAWQAPEENTAETGSMGGMLATQYVSEIFRLAPRSNTPKPQILDYGAGRGALMKALQEAGCEAVGVEPYGHERLAAAGFRVFEDAAQIPSGQKFDGAISLDVAEHLRTPWETFAKIRACLKPAGWLVVGTPNPTGLNALLTRSKWREAQKPAHITFMNEKTLARMLKSAGYAAITPARLDIRFQRSALADTLVNPALRSLGLGGAATVIAFNSNHPNLGGD
jgi:2-polyprenyl-3-methyl-5-hydroxy-6-metoxy-1,4-benzoquinol methylase